MKSAFKVIILLMIGFIILGGCSTPTDTADSQEQSAADKVTFGNGINASQIVDSNTNGMLDYGNYPYTFWKDTSAGSVSMTLDEGSGYTTTANSITGGFVCGRGWKNVTGNATRVIHYNGSYNSSYGGAFGVYG